MDILTLEALLKYVLAVLRERFRKLILARAAADPGRAPVAPSTDYGGKVLCNAPTRKIQEAGSFATG